MKFEEGESYSWLFWKVFFPAVVIVGMGSAKLFNTLVPALGIFAAFGFFLLVTTLRSHVALNGRWVASHVRGSVGYISSLSMLVLLVSFSSYGVADCMGLVSHRDGRHGRRDPKIDSQIAKLQAADPTADVATALASGDTRFVGVMGIGLMVPGVDPSRYGTRDRVKVIPNTSDSFSTDSAAELEEVACRYAEKYNRALMVKLGMGQ
jgi:hypothetical protein